MVWSFCPASLDLPSAEERRGSRNSHEFLFYFIHFFWWVEAGGQHLYCLILSAELSQSGMFYHSSFLRSFICAANIQISKINHCKTVTIIEQEVRLISKRNIWTILHDMLY